MTSRSSNRIVTLRNGLSVPLEALQLLWSLEDRDLDVTLSPEGKLRVCPRSALTSADYRAITTHRDMLRQLVTYCEVAV